MSNFYFGRNENDSDNESDEDITQENPIISASQPGRELDKSNIFNRE